MSDDRLTRVGGPGDAERTTGVALLLHGGREFGTSGVGRFDLPVLRIDLLAHAVRGPLVAAGIAIYRLRFSVRGWNGDGASAIADATEALDEIVRRETWDAAPPRITVVGHSMGGRTAVHVAGHPAVHTVVGLAPWLPDGEAVHDWAGRRLRVAHGTLDRTTSPSASRRFVDRAVAAGADGEWKGVPGEGHALLRRPRWWNRFVVDALNYQTP